MSRAALTRDTFPTDFGVMRRLSDEMDRMFQGFSLPRAFSLATADQPWAPAIETFTRDGTFVVRVDLPGLTEKDVTVEIAGDVLAIAGERVQETESTTDGTFTSERRYGRFERGVRLPDGVNAAQAAATFTNGVLQITVPVTTPAQPDVTKVAVKAG